MKRGLALMALILALALLLPVPPSAIYAKASSSQALGDVLTYEVAFQEPEVLELAEGSLIEVPGCIQTLIPGLPIIPAKTAVIVLPPGKELLNVSVQALDGRELPGTYELLVAPQPRMLGLGPGAGGHARPTALGVFPEHPYHVGKGVKVWRGYRLLPLTLFPIQYDAYEGRVTFYRRFLITLSLADGGTYGHARPSPAVLRALRELAINPEVLGEYQVEASSEKGYLIITRPLFSSVANQLGSLLLDEGYTVHIEYVDDIVADYTGSDIPEKIRNCIKDYYNSYSYEDLYVLLLGDADPDDATSGYELDKDWEVPTRYIYNPDPDDGYDNAYTGLPNDLTPSDFYYAGLDGTWDDDGDGYYGEGPSYSSAGVDEADWLAEVWVGRLPVRTVEQASLYVAKLDAYLDSLRNRDKPMLLLGAHLFDTDPSYYTDGAWACDKSATFYPPEVVKRRLYENEGNLTYANVVDEINTQDPEFVCSASHGSIGGLWLYWTSETFADTSTPSYVANTGFIWYAMACLSGAFDVDEDTKGACFSEAMIRDDDGSSVAHIGATRVSWGYVSNWFLNGLCGMHTWLFWYSLSRSGPEGPGKALYIANAYYYIIWQANIEQYEYDRKVLLAQMLCGNPALPAARGTATYNGPQDVRIGDEGVVEGWNLATSSAVSIYLERFHWDTYEHERILAGEGYTDIDGYLYATFEVPEAVEPGAWYDIMVADDRGNYIYAGSVHIQECQLILKPDRGHGNFVVNATGLGFSPNASVGLYLLNIHLANFTTDDTGRFTGFFIVPSVNPGSYEVRAVDEDGHEATRALYVLDATPLNVLIDVGSLHFRGELVEFYILTLHNGTRVDADITRALLYKGDHVYADLMGSLEHIARGLFRATYTIPANAPMGTYVLLVEAHYKSGLVDARGASLKSFLVSSVLHSWNATLSEIRSNVATLITDMGEVKMSLSELREMLESVNATLEAVKGDVAVIKANTSTILAKLDVLNATLVTLIEDSKGEVLASIETAVGTLRADLGTVLELLDAIKSTLEGIAEDVSAIRVAIEGWTGSTALVAGKALLILTTSELEEGPDVLEGAMIRLLISGPPGTEGQLVVVLQKAILRAIGASISDVVMLLDMELLEFTWSDKGTYYVLRASYLHSAHELLIHLRGRLDDDGDGLANWEELVRGLDPRNPDTDGDLWPDAVDPCPKDPTMPNGPAGAAVGVALAVLVAVFIRRRTGH